MHEDVDRFTTPDGTRLRVAESGSRAIESLRGAELSPGQRAAVQNHERELSQSLTQARRLEFIVDRSGPLLVVAVLIGLGVLALAYIAASVVLGVVAAWAGVQLGRAIA